MTTILADETSSSVDMACLASLTDAVGRYFDLMYDCDVSRFAAVFAPTVQLHGYRDGQMVCWSAQAYRDILAARRSPKASGDARADEILMLDLVSPDMAFVKVRLRIHAMVFVDYLTWHRIDGDWRVTSKGFHLASGG